MSSWDIMLSYNWTSGGAIADKLEPILKEKGYTIWRDRNEMSKNNNMNLSMAEAVNNSKIILVFMSQEYEDSPACGKELNYADSKGKTIIPLKVTNFRPTPGKPLDFLMANKLYYVMYENFEENVKNLLVAIENNLGEYYFHSVYDMISVSSFNWLFLNVG